MDELIATAEARALLGASLRTWSRLVARHGLRPARAGAGPGGQHLWRRQEVEALARERQPAIAPTSPAPSPAAGAVDPRLAFWVGTLVERAEQDRARAEQDRARAERAEERAERAERLAASLAEQLERATRPAETERRELPPARRPKRARSADA